MEMSFFCIHSTLFWNTSITCQLCHCIRLTNTKKVLTFPGRYFACETGIFAKQERPEVVPARGEWQRQGKRDTADVACGLKGLGQLRFQPDKIRHGAPRPAITNVTLE